MKDLSINKSILALPMLGLLLHCGQALEVDTSTKDPKIQTVEVVTPAYHSFSTDVQITGTVKANRSVALHAMESGYVQKMFVDIGDHVIKGEVLTGLINPELNQLSDEIGTQYIFAKKHYERLAATYEKTPDLTPLDVLEKAESDHKSLKAQFDLIIQRIEFLQVKAPFDGIITARLVDEGTLVQGGIGDSDAQALFKIEELDPVRVVLPVPGADAANIHVGSAVLIEFPELAAQPYSAVVSRTSGSLDPGSRTMQVEIDIPNGEGRIKPGMYAKAEMKLESRDSVLSLPATAQHILYDSYFLMTVEDQKVKLVELKKGLADPDHFEVLNADIDHNTQVITQGRDLVKEGQQVEPVLKKEQP